MATAPEFFDYVASSTHVEVAAAAQGTEEIRDGFRGISTMIRLGVAGAAMTLAGLFVVALADARLSDEAFVRLAGWF